MNLKKSTIIEALTWIGVVAFLVLRMSRLLIEGSSTLPHDNFNNYFPAFHFLLDNLFIGQLPLWNPFSHGGEPFYPILLQERLLEPLTYLNLLVLKHFTADYLFLHNWNRFLQSLFMIGGMYLVLRRYTTQLITRVVLIFTLCLSSTLLGSFQQEGILHQFLWAPFVVFSLQKILEDGDRRRRHFLLLGISIGVNFQSYLFAGISLLLLFTIVGITLISRHSLKGFDKRYFISLFILLLMVGPNLAVFSERSDYVFPMRMFSKEFEKDQIVGGPMQWEGSPGDVRPAMKMDYALASRTGSTSTVWDYLQLFAPGGNPIIHGLRHAWGDPSEAFLYLGIFVWFSSLWGLFVANHPSAKVWRVSFFAWGLMTLGVAGGLHRLLFPIFPPLWVMRNTHCFVLYFQFAALFFFIQGFESLMTKPFPWKVRLGRVPLLLGTGVLFFVAIHWASLLKFEHLSLTPFALFAIFLLVVILRKFCTQSEVFLLLVAAQFTFIFRMTSDRSPLVALWTLALVLPVLALFFRNIAMGLAIPHVRWVSSLLILFSVSSDLFHHFYLSRHLFQLQPDPKQYMDVDTAFRPPIFPASRSTTEYYPNFFLKTDPPIQQIPRYMSLLLRKPYALSPIFERKDKTRKESFEWARLSKRWNSFLMLKNYFELIHSQRIAAELEDAFAIDRPLVQFRTAPDSDGTDLWLRPDSLSGAPPRVSRYHYSSITVDTRTNRDGYLYYSDGFHRHWRALLDDNEVPVLKTNGNFKAVNLPKGIHRVQFKYQPRAFLLSVYLFFATFVTTVFVIATSYLVPLPTLWVGPPISKDALTPQEA